jgi:hypothetical protein
MPKANQPLSDEEILVKHAFRGSSFAVVRLEELTEIGNLKADAVACYRPVNAQEIFAIEHIALCQQRLLRGFRLESGLFTTALDYCLEGDGRTFRPMSENMVGHGDIEITRAQNRSFAAGEGLRIMVKESDVWSVLLRFQVNAERQYRRAVEDFERLKRMRPEMPNHPDVGTAPDVIDDIAPLREINPMIRLEPDPCEPEPAAAPVEPSNLAPDAPEDGATLAPAAASTPKTQEPTSRIHSSNAPDVVRLKTAPADGRFKAALAFPRRRANNSASSQPCRPRNSACRRSSATSRAASSHPPEPSLPDSGRAPSLASSSPALGRHSGLRVS